MPYTKIGQDHYRGPSGRVYTAAQVRAIKKKEQDAKEQSFRIPKETQEE